MIRILLSRSKLELLIMNGLCLESFYRHNSVLETEMFYYSNLKGELKKKCCITTEEVF